MQALSAIGTGLKLPSGGDCSYPGLAWQAGLLRVSYYSSHEGKTSIYLATVALPAKRVDRIPGMTSRIKPSARQLPCGH